VQLRSWMIPAEACPGTFVTLKGACGKTTTQICPKTAKVMWLTYFASQSNRMNFFLDERSYFCNFTTTK
jgi:hypothetical protein